MSRIMTFPDSNRNQRTHMKYFSIVNTSFPVRKLVRGQTEEESTVIVKPIRKKKKTIEK